MHGAATVIALSSGALPSGVAVIRISGDRCRALLERFCGGVPPARRLVLRRIVVGAEEIDRGLVAFFPSPNSFTGEDCAELHLHGSRAVVAAVLRGLTAVDGVALAAPGEFTRRAFENGRLDLAQVEGLGDLIAAETEAQRRLAADRAHGGMSGRVAVWRSVLIAALAEVEARLDFADEDDVDAEVPEKVVDAIAALRAELRAALAGYDGGRVVREGFRVVLAGPPNVGKSSLLNALSRSDVAIVTPEPGTTRDVREVPVALDGLLVLFVDTAGLRETDSLAEGEGVRRARDAMESADLVLWLTAPDVAGLPVADETSAPIWRIAGKRDLGPPAGGADLAVSALTGEGIAGLLARIGAAARDRVGDAPLLISRERDRMALVRCVEALDGFASAGALELDAERLRSAARALDRLIGRIDAEEVLDGLFAAFCIGK